MDHVIEIRAYRLKEGSAGQFHRIMQDECLPLLRAAGIDVVAARPSLHAPDAYMLVRAYPSLDHRNDRQDAFYASQAWLQGPRDALMACIDTYNTVVMEADRSVIEGMRSLSA